ncbi:MAG: hypothetical protein ACOCRO_07615 [Halanaerobiales bacterium]
MLGSFNNEKQEKKQQIDAISRCITWMGLKNPNKLVEIEQGVYCHTNARGNKKFFIAMYGWNKYNNWYKKNKDKQLKFFKANGYYVVRLQPKQYIEGKDE